MKTKIIYNPIIVILFTFSSLYGNAQQLSYIDPAQAYNRLVLEKNGGTFRVIDNYKVTGSPYLYGDMYNGVVSEGKAKGENLSFKYNVYDQTLEILTTAQGKYLIKTAEEIDSFYFKGSPESVIVSDLKFISSKKLDAEAKPMFMHPMVIGKKYNLYKSYMVTLGNVSHAYLNSDQRQFDLNADYYYTSTELKALHKVRMTKAWLTKEFKDIDVDQILKDFKLASQPEMVLNTIFDKLNTQQ